MRLDQARSAGLTAGLPAQVVLRSNPGRAVAGKVARVETISDSVTEERVAQVSFDQAPSDLSVGELAEVTLSLPPTANAVLLPNAAIRWLQAQIGVWTLDGGDLRFAGAHWPDQSGWPGADPRGRQTRHDGHRVQRKGHRRAQPHRTAVETLAGQQP